MRPIYHRLAHRVRSHVFLCLLAYYVEWQMREKLAPLLFEEEEWLEPVEPNSVVVPKNTRLGQNAKFQLNVIWTIFRFKVFGRY
ncbi:hypothetical protein [Microcoleus sp. F4-D5]|uniref:hypothetical protein n=1 Tax=Microcoleus sp. F4-D5 TaxID=2818760 RepID=UPI002FD183B4